MNTLFLKIRRARYKILAVIIFVFPLLSILYHLSGVEGFRTLMITFVVSLGFCFWLLCVLFLLFK